MTVEELKTELEIIISSLTASGFSNIDPLVVKSLDELTTTAEELNMKEGKRLIGNLVKAMMSAKKADSKIESCNVRLMALDFYVKKLSVVGNIQEF